MTKPEGDPDLYWFTCKVVVGKAVGDLCLRDNIQSLSFDEIFTFNNKFKEFHDSHK